MGKIYAALDLKRRQRCAVKLVRPEADHNLHAYRRFSNEAKVVSRLFHPNIVTVREFNQDSDGTEFMVLELLDGMDLHETLTMYGRMPLRRALEVLRGIGSALQYAHDLGIVHRDVKPENIFLCKQRSASGRIIESVKLLDFGLAKLSQEEAGAAMASGDGEARLTKGMAVGTPAYLAPEATFEGPPIDGRADQWSLAVVAYQMLSGKLPFDHSHPLFLCKMICMAELPPLLELVPDLPRHVIRAIEIALSKDPAQRFSRIHEFIRTLDGVAPLLDEAGGPHIIHVDTPFAEEGSTSPAQQQEVLGDTLGKAEPSLSAEHTRWLHAEDLPTIDEQGSSDLRKTVQYSADELLALASQSMSAQYNAPQMLDVDTPTKPYRCAPDGGSADFTLADDINLDMQDSLRVKETLIIAPDSNLSAPLPSLPSASMALQSRPRPSTKKPLRVPWLGIGAGSAMFCLGFLLALIWSACQPHVHGLS